MLGISCAAKCAPCCTRDNEVHVFAPGRGEHGELAANDGARLHWLGDHGAFGWPGAWPRLKENPARVFGIGEFALRARRALQREGPFARLQAHFLLPSGWPITTLAPSATVGHRNRARRAWLGCAPVLSLTEGFAEADCARLARAWRAAAFDEP